MAASVCVRWQCLPERLRNPQIELEAAAVSQGHGSSVTEPLVPGAHREGEGPVAHYGLSEPPSLQAPVGEHLLYPISAIFWPGSVMEEEVAP